MVEVGLKFSKSIVSTVAESAEVMGSGDMQVFATPAMIALMEGAAMELLASHLSSNESSVGIQIASTHIKATKIGSTVSATAEVVAVEGRKITFKIVAEDETAIIGEATHDRFIVDRERFLSKL